MRDQWRDLFEVVPIWNWHLLLLFYVFWPSSALVKKRDPAKKTPTPPPKKNPAIIVRFKSGLVLRFFKTIRAQCDSVRWYWSCLSLIGPFILMWISVCFIVFWWFLDRNSALLTPGAAASLFPMRHFWPFYLAHSLRAFRNHHGGQLCGLQVSPQTCPPLCESTRSGMLDHFVPQPFRLGLFVVA